VDNKDILVRLVVDSPRLRQTSHKFYQIHTANAARILGGGTVLRDYPYRGGCIVYARRSAWMPLPDLYSIRVDPGTFYVHFTKVLLPMSIRVTARVDVRGEETLDALSLAPPESSTLRRALAGARIYIDGLEIPTRLQKSAEEYLSRPQDFQLSRQLVAAYKNKTHGKKGLTATPLPGCRCMCNYNCGHPWHPSDL
jgi:hypothetical protein